MSNIFIEKSAVVADNCKIGAGTKIWHNAQIREGVSIGDNCSIGKNVYIDHNVTIKDKVKVQNNVSIYFDAEIEEGVFIGPHVCFTNDKYPRSINPDGTIKSGGTNTHDWTVHKTVVKTGASIGANATILPGITVGKWAVIGSGSVVTRDVPDYAVVVGNPAQVVGKACTCGRTLQGENCATCNIQTVSSIPIAKPVVGEEEKRAVIEVLDSGMLVQGRQVQRLEEEFANLCSVQHAIATTSGTSALHTALYAAGIKPGDEVITTPFSFIATVNCILMQGATPVFADIKKDTYNIDPDKVKEKVTPRTKAIIAVDLYGQIHDYTKLKEIAQQNDLILIEDACQSINAELNGIKAGKCGDIAVFSLYATKNITSGEGGMMVTGNSDYARRARMFRFHGQADTSKYEYQDLGYNYRMTDLQAAIAIKQLQKLDLFTNKRIENAALLTDGLKDVEGIRVPVVKPNSKHVFHQYTIHVNGFKLTRDQLMEHLRNNNIGCNVFYPQPLHLQQHLQKYGFQPGDCPVAEAAAQCVLSIPIHPALRKEDIERIIQVIKSA